MYNDFLHMDLAAQTSIIGFADDALFMCATEDVDTLELRNIQSLWRKNRWLSSVCLEWLSVKSRQEGALST